MPALPFALALAAWSFLVEPRHLTVRRLSVQSTKWPQLTKPVKVAVITDLHVGCPHLDLKVLETIVERTNRLEADVVILLGDFLIRGVLFGSFIPPRPVAERLGGLRAPHGVISVLGNHDWWYDGYRIWQELERAGITVLENDAHPIDLDGCPIWFAGLADASTRSPDVPLALAGVPEGDPLIILSHDPQVFPDIPRRAVLTLAGQTHGGQINLPFFNPLVTPGHPMEHASGVVRLDGKRMYVSTGIGTSVVAARFNVPPEIVLVTVGPRRP